jgi:hypothetical protein
VDKLIRGYEGMATTHWNMQMTLLSLLLKIFWVVAPRQFLVYDQHFEITCLSQLQGLRQKGKKDFYLFT